MKKTYQSPVAAPLRLRIEGMLASSPGSISITPSETITSEDEILTQEQTSGSDIWDSFE